MSRAAICSIKEWSQRKAKAISLKDLYQYNLNVSPKQRLRNAEFLLQELPIRLAQRIDELSNLPFGLSHNRNIESVKNIYVNGFNDLILCGKPDSIEEDTFFTGLLSRMLKDHSAVVQTVALGVLEVRKEIHFDSSMNEILNLYLNRFFMARIGVRFLIEQHIQSKNNRVGYSGIIQSNCDPVAVTRIAASDAVALCERQFGVAPEIKICAPHDINFTYVPGHLSYIISELLKNSLRATVSHYNEGEKLPAVEVSLSLILSLWHSLYLSSLVNKVVIVKGPNDVTIKVSDKGGGIPYNKVDNIWNYVTTDTTPTSTQRKKLARLEFRDASMELISAGGIRLNTFILTPIANGN